ncbi:GGDEF domain-containing protein [Lachnospiraceae bacterium OM04-12BH]|nr:GGDEF domain-containing protein [Lachnospiraceae bacterium OM04-12BH]
MINQEVQSDKKSKNIIGIVQSCLILILVVLIIYMMIQISRLQGTARVINYAGLVRGATQREVKLEITGNQDEELINYLDDILSGLRYQDGHYDLVRLYDKEYQEKLQIQSDYWDKLKIEIEAVRNVGYENTDIVNMSEIYFKMADETVFAAENYSQRIAERIRTIELLSALDMLCLVILVIIQTMAAMKMAVKNKLLAQEAYTDAHTGLPNKRACKELLINKEIIKEPTACIMFDLNNLKTVNDTMGHSAGDQLIMNFARLLRSVIPEKDFVGRYGGDEFMAVMYHTSRTEVEEILKCLCEEKDRINSNENQMPVDYACGWALSADDRTYTMQMLMDKADFDMYANKQLYKRDNFIDRKEKSLYNPY